MLQVERAFIGFDSIGVVALRPVHGGELIAADCLAASLPKVGAVVSPADVRAWAAALSGAETPNRGALDDPPPASRVLSGGSRPSEVQQQRIKTREFGAKSGTQGAFTPVVIPSAYSGDVLPGVILG